ncbi:DUF2599 domain-containing protein [Mycolicibacterium sp. XJ662]
MRPLLTLAVTVAGVLGSVALAPTVSADPAVPVPPYVDDVEWAKWGDLSSLRVYPTDSGREAAGLASPIGLDAAWSEVLALSPDADLPGMRAQFECHWYYAEIIEPGKTSWNLEPWRPEVSDDAMFVAGCNPGGTEEPF